MSSPMSGANTLDRLILEALRFDVHTVSRSEAPQTCLPIYGPRAVVLGRFVLTCYDHSTGNSVCAWILDDFGGAYQFIATTFWFSSCYTFNDHKREHGKWDAAFEAELDALRKELVALEAHVGAATLARKESDQQEESREKARFEALFLETGGAPCL